jgi:Ca-activated chloride channel homolog
MRAPAQGALACALLQICALANAATTAPATTEGRLATRDGTEVIDVPLKHTTVAITVSGHLADVEVKQIFQNPYKNKIEATYLFPLPTQAAVNSMSLTTGGVTIEGEIKLRDEAKQIYTAALAKGNVAVLLTQERPNLFQQHVANIEPGAELTVTLRYVQALPYDDGAYELVFPMVAGPRHVPASSKIRPEDAKLVQPSALPAGLRPAHDISLSVALDAGVPIGAVTSPSHLLSLTRDGDRRAAISLGAGDTIPNKDFILRYAVAGQTPQLAVMTHRSGESGALFLVAQPPAQAAQVAVAPRELVFVLDTSSSMAGAPLAKAKEAIRQTLKTMGPDDTFQIIRFDDTASALGARPINNKPRNIELALHWLDALGATGGTDMIPGLKAALTFPHDPARLRIVAFLTDGYIGNEDEVLAAVQANLGPARLFSFGVGSAVNRYLLEELAAIGRGTVQVVRPDEDTAAAVASFTRRIARPVLTDVMISWGGLDVQSVVPAAIPDLFVGQPLVVSARFGKPGRGTVVVTATSGGRPVRFELAVELPEKAERPAVASVWARARIAELSRQQLRGEKDAIRKEITDLALSHHLMTAYTAFVAVDGSKVTKEGKVTTVAVPVHVPQGVRRADMSTSLDGGGGGYTYGLGGTAQGYSGSMSYGSAAPMDSVTVSLPVAAPKTVVLSPTPSTPPVTEHQPAREPTKFEDNKDKARDSARERLAIQRCLADARKRNPKLSKLTLDITVEESGEVSAHRLSEANDAALASCMDAAVKGWRLPAPGKRATMTLPLTDGGAP